ncbi:MAG: phBC6A51 family helix-turn-helix protein [Patescibacteria group bacterium]
MTGKQLAKKKRLATLSVKTAEQKLAVLEHLTKCCIVQLACERVGVGRSTYYKWLSEDKEFKGLANKAINTGREYLNDIAISGLLKKIQEGHLTALIFWLKNNHVWFAERIRHEYHLVDNDGILPDEQREQIVRACRISGMLGTFIRSEELKEKFLASKSAEQNETHDEIHSSAHVMSDEERISDWGTGKPQEKFKKELERELKRDGVNIEEFLKNYKKK